MTRRVVQSRPKRDQHGFVSYARHAEGVWEITRAAATGEVVWWTVHADAEPNDLVLFYCMKPLGAFFAYGRVVQRIERRFRRNKPMAEVGLVRLLPAPVTISDAKAKLSLAWLKTAQGFERGPREGVDILIAMGEGR
jgi:hypothetical protein